MGVDPLLALPFVGLALAWGIHRLVYRSSALVGLLLLIALFLPTSMAVSEGYLSSLAQPMTALLQATLCLIPPLALVASCSLLCLAVSLRRRGRTPEAASDRPQTSWLPPVVLGILSALLLAKTLHDIYWLTVWDSTGDSMIFLLLVPSVSATLVAGLLALNRPGIARWAGLLFVPLAVCLMIGVYVSARSVDYRQLTESRAGEVEQSIQTYHAREGSYPRDLRELSPRYALWLPEPVIIYGQDWCYDAGDGYFRLGYVYRENWSSPELIGRLYASHGAAPDQPNVCQSEIAALKARKASHW